MPENTTVLLRGSTGVMAAWGFHYYLTQLCHCQVSWDADQLDLPVILPEVSIRVSSLDKYNSLIRIKKFKNYHK
jgi:alpha-N-acetylglucosaminidase